MTVRWLIDRSALWRATRPEINEVLQPRISRGLVGVSIATELEIGFSAQSAADYEFMRDRLVIHLVPTPMPVSAENRARRFNAAWWAAAGTGRSVCRTC